MADRRLARLLAGLAAVGLTGLTGLAAVAYLAPSGTHVQAQAAAQAQAGAQAAPPTLQQHHRVDHPELDGKAAAVPQQLVIRVHPQTPASAVAALERRLGVTRVQYVEAIGADAVRLPANVTPDSVRAAAARDRAVLGATPNHVLRAFDYAPSDPDFATAIATSHDGLQSQWALRKVGAPAAWAGFRGPGSVVVAVVDTGVDSSHPDLAGVVLPGYNELDANADTFDDHGHGTMVAGVIGAVTDNGLGIAGLSFNTARILPVKVLDAAGNGSEIAVAGGITYAADHGALIVNLSLGGPTYSQAVQDAVRYAWSKGALVVAAAGNSGDATRQYPAANAWALGVAASDQNDAVTPFSSFGDEVALTAPGLAILSTTPTYPVTMTRGDGYRQGYDAFSGTSSATPLVSGLAALLLAQHPGSPADTMQRLERSAHALAPAWDPHSGYGRLDAAAAIAGTPGPATGGAIRGQVVDASGAPVGGALVSAGGVKQTTGADGTYRLAALATTGNPYTVTVQAGAATYLSQPLTVVAGADTFTDVVAGGGARSGAPATVNNGGFEAGSFSGWTAGGGSPAPVLSTAQVHSGSYSALLGSASGAELAGDSSLTQTIHVQVPSGSARATLSFWTWTASTDAAAFDWQEAQVRDAAGAQLAPVMKGAANDLAWKRVTYDLTPFNGRDVQLYFNVHSDGAGDLTWMYLDDVEVDYS